MKTANFQLFLKAVPEEDADFSSSRDRKALHGSHLHPASWSTEAPTPLSVSKSVSLCCAVPTAREEVFCKATLRMSDLRLRLIQV